MEVVNTKTCHMDSFIHEKVMFPRKEPQIKLMKELLDDSKLKPNDISFVEASGIAIKSVDAEELSAIDEVFGNRKEPLLLGSIKSVIGNTGSANTNAAIVKVFFIINFYY